MALGKQFREIKVEKEENHEAKPYINALNGVFI